MVIERKHKHTVTAFHDIKCGDFFEYEGDLYIKLTDALSADCISNAFNCNTHAMRRFNDQKVYLVNAKVVVDCNERHDRVKNTQSNWSDAFTKSLTDEELKSYYEKQRKEGANENR